MTGRTMRLGLAIAAALTTMVVAGCSDESADPHTPTVENVTARVIVPAYERAAATTMALAGKADAFCTQPGAASLSDARATWRSARRAWGAVEPYAFGPAATRRSESFVSPPADTVRIAALLARPEPVAPETLRSSASSVRGLAAIEVVLFAAGSPASIATIQGCGYLDVATGVVAGDVAQLRDDWTKARDGGESSFAIDLSSEESPKDAVDMIVGRQIFVMKRLVDQQIGPASRLTARAQRALTLGEGPGGDQAAVITAQLTSIRASYDSASGPSLGDLHPTASTGTKDAFLTDLDAVIARAKRVTGPLADDRTALVELAELSEEAEVALTTEVVSALGVTVGFSDSDSDGDSDGG